MGAAFAMCMGNTSAAKEKSEADISGGLVKDRHCTDIVCCIIFVASIVLWFLVSVIAIPDGQPSKLWLPRDFQGAYCDTETNWNGGPNTLGKTKLTYTMNVTATTDLIAKQFLCSSAVSDYLSSSGNMTTTELSEYMCECCLTPCAKCDGSLEVGGDLDLANIGSVISQKMTDLTSANNAGDLFSPAGANGDTFTNMWTEATKYFNQVCLPDCATDYITLNNTESPRTFAYTPPVDNTILTNAWGKLFGTSTPTVIKDTIQDYFTFKALPESTCPYSPRYCVPFPGVKFEELSAGYCTFEMASEVIGAVGESMSSAWSTLGGDGFSSSAVETFGMWIGDFMDSLDAFFLTGIAGFIIGLIFLILLRWFVKPCVWLAIFFIFFLFALGGGMLWVRSFQCDGVGFWDTSHQAAVAVTVTATTAAANAVTGTEPVSEDMTSGDPIYGGDYRGVQYHTITGRTCRDWGDSAETTLVIPYDTDNWPNNGLTATDGNYNNYCRNPFNSTDVYKASTIWCFTSDTEKKWEECRPIGVIQPECEYGYAISSETGRKVLEIAAYVVWSLSGVWLLIVLCFQKRIRLAIALNQVGAAFVGQTKFIIFVPMVQIVCSICFQLLWAFLASFIITQVPDDYMPMGSYTWYDAAGADNTETKCLGKWPEGLVWKDEENCELGVNNSLACYRCAPPRYIVGDGRFAFVFFSYLWNNAFMIAVGQCVIAGAVAAWFFTPNAEKGKTKVIRTSLWNCFRYHTGSLAFGAFILAVVQFIRYLMKYFEKQAAAQKNKLMVIILKVAQCCIWCFEQCIKFLNKNAYIQVAMRGTNFCTSAKKAFQIILANLIRFGVVAILGSAIQSIGFIFIMLGTSISGYFIIKGLHPDINTFVPMVMYILMSYVIGMLYMNVFGMAVDTSLQCVIFAEEKGIDADTCPSALTSVLKTSKKKSEDEDI